MVNRLPLPGAGPDLVLLVVIGLAIVVGPTAGSRRSGSAPGCSST